MPPFPFPYFWERQSLRGPMGPKSLTLKKEDSSDAGANLEGFGLSEGSQHRRTNPLGFRFSEGAGWSG